LTNTQKDAWTTIATASTRRRPSLPTDAPVRAQCSLSEQAGGAPLGAPGDDGAVDRVDPNAVEPVRAAGLLDGLPDRADVLAVDDGERAGR
jgi:hypothetical protein